MSGTELITAERQRQIEMEGWTPEHDDAHEMSELSRAAVTYSVLASKQAIIPGVSMERGAFWPWDALWWKPSRDPIRNLVKAGALIAAEIDRLQRKQARHG